MKIKKIIKIGCGALLCGAFLSSGIIVGKTAWTSYNIQKKEKIGWSENVSKYREAGQFYHPSQTKVLTEQAKDDVSDIYAYESSFKSRFLWDLSYKVNILFNTDFLWGWKRLTKNKAVDEHPAYSPDGEYIAFSSNKKGDFDIWVMDEDGKNQIRITKSLGDETNPVWINEKVLKYHIVKDGKSFYETIDLESSKILEQVKIERGALVGDKAINFDLEDVNGKNHTLDDYLGQVVILNFWATWCGPCREEITSLNKFYENKNENVQVLSITSDGKEKLRGFLEKTNVLFPVLLSENRNVGEEYLIKAIPATIIIDKEGKIVNRYVGVTDFTGEKFKKTINDLLTK